jgi:lipoprotein-anchoring transpeptidase ErfK/SrfK
MARRALVPTALVVGALLLSGCGQVALRAGAPQPQSRAVITVTPAPTGEPVAPGAPLVVEVAQGRLTDVVVTGPTGELPGTLAEDGRTWTSRGRVLDFGATYTVVAAAVDRQGLPTTAESTLRTVAPTKFLDLRVSPRAGSVVGVGMPLTLSLDRDLSAAARARFESALRVSADGAPVLGAWSWTGKDTVTFRPETYWPGDAEIRVVAAIKGVRFSGGAWGERTVRHTFRTGPAVITYVDMDTHRLTYTRDGEKVRAFPITTGKDGFVTRSGVKVIMSKERTRLMDAATGGTDEDDPEYYRLEVDYAMRVTNSGEFLHAAPWSVSSQGRANVSHGCTGMSTADAAWLYANSRVGDVVVYTGSNRRMEPWNGMGLWNVPWDEWVAGSAL